MYASVGTPNEPMPMRRAVLIWLAVAMIGWVTVVVSAYTVMRFGDTVLAGIEGVFVPVSGAGEEKSLNNIVPAAGKRSN